MTYEMPDNSEHVYNKRLLYIPHESGCNPFTSGRCTHGHKWGEAATFTDNPLLPQLHQLLFHQSHLKVQTHLHIHPLPLNNNLHCFLTRIPFCSCYHFSLHCDQISLFRLPIDTRSSFGYFDLNHTFGYVTKWNPPIGGLWLCISLSKTSSSSSLVSHWSHSPFDAFRKRNCYCVIINMGKRRGALRIENIAEARAQMRTNDVGVNIVPTPTTLSWEGR